MLRTEQPVRPARVDDLLDAGLAARLSGIDLTSRKILAGKMKGERRSRRRGQSVEFADHRPYVTGDDLRHIDWNIFGRLDRMFLKLFLEEEDLGLHLVLDASGSHDCGEPGKFLCMQRLALALGFVGLANMHRVSVNIIGGAPAAREGAGGEAGAGAGGVGDGAGGGIEPVTALRDLRGRRRLTELARFLCGVRPAGAGAFTEGCKRIALTRRGKGVTVVLSDFFIKEGYEQGLRLLVGRGFDVYAVQVLSPQELSPTLGGDLRLRDVEDGDVAELTISAPLLKRYQATLAAYGQRLNEFCVRRGIALMTVSSDAAIDQLVLEHLRSRGLVR